MKSFIGNLFVFVIVIMAVIHPQDKKNLIYTDKSGIMRWTANGEPAYFFGINYTAPFAFSYRALKSKGISVKETIDADIKHFKRMNLNAFRIHVWDREISDSAGDVIQNDHLALLDYLLARLMENDIYVILTPIAWWGNGWPEPDEKTEGFSEHYSKIESTTKPEALKKHKNYLKQFVNHLNPYTGKTYKEENKIIAFEIFNEPNFPKESKKVTEYVNETIGVLHKEGITKPIFFNISENPGKEAWHGVASADIEGVTFQWYPTGLVKYSELKGNYIPNVLEYKLPEYSADISGKAKMVYEFDAADIANSYMYPLMAHSFRKAGMQWATMFAYDPTPLARYNAEYSTHYLNLLYTPQKALGFLIASELFQSLQTGDKVRDKNRITMDNVFISNNENLAVLNTGDKYYYTNSNEVNPSDINVLSMIAGFGNSPVIKYSGTGAYFLDKVQRGIWKLEILPDAVWLRDPFGKNGLTEPVAKLISKTQTIKILLPGFEKDFIAVNVAAPSDVKQSEDNAVTLSPGVYWIIKSMRDLTGADPEAIHNKSISVPAGLLSDENNLDFKNETEGSFCEGDSVVVKVSVFAKRAIIPDLYIKRDGWRGFSKLQFTKTGGYQYSCLIPGEMNKNGLLKYFISVADTNGLITIPGNKNSSPDNWDFNDIDAYTIKILPPTNRRTIFEPGKDNVNIAIPDLWRYFEYRAETSFSPDGEPGIEITVSKVKEASPEFAFQVYCGDSFGKRKTKEKDTIAFELSAINLSTDSIHIRIVDDCGYTFSARVIGKDVSNRFMVAVKDFQRERVALLPRPYPVFLPYWSNLHLSERNGSLSKPELIQIAFPVPENASSAKPCGIFLNKIIYINAEE